MKEKKSLRLIVILLTICLVLGQVKPIPLYADSGATEVVTLDSSSGSIEPGSLESKVKETGVTDPSRVSELHITTDISGELNSDDIAYLNKLVNIKVLNIGNTITIGDLGDDFMNGLGTTNFDALESVSLPTAISFGDDAFRHCDRLTSVSLPGVISFGDNAFRQCVALEAIDLPAVTSFGTAAFTSCSVLNSVNLPLVESFEDFAFSSCLGLVSIDLPKVKSFGDYALLSCSSLESVSLPKVSSFGEDLFDLCGNLSELTLGSNPPSVGGWGDYGVSPRTLDVPSSAVNVYDGDQQTWSPAGTEYDGLWEGWTLPKTIIRLDESNGAEFIAGSLQDRVEAFGVTEARQVNELYIEDSVTGEFNQDDIDYLNSMFNLEVLDVATSIEVGDVGNDFMRGSYGPVAGTESLRKVTFPASTFGNAAFYECGELESVSLPLATTFGDYAFGSCTGLSSVSLSSAATFGSDAFYNCDTLSSISLPSATTFSDEAFYDCKNLESVSLPSAQTFGKSAFVACSELESISLPSATTFGDSTFRECSKLNELTLGSQFPSVTGWGTGFTPGTLNIPSDAVNAYDANQQIWSPEGTDYDGLWEGWTLPKTIIRLDASNGAEFIAGSLQDRVEAFGVTDARQVNELYIESSVTGEFNQDDIDYLNTMFNLEVLDVATSIEVADVGDDFLKGSYSNPYAGYVAGTEALREVTFPARVFGWSAFEGCSELESVNLPLATTFGTNAFTGCGKLKSVSLPSATTFRTDAFTLCDELKSVSLPSATIFGYDAFNGCSKLESISLPLVTTFGNNAFAGCSELESVSLPSAITFGFMAFSRCTNLNELTLGSQIPTVAGWGINFTPGALNLPGSAVSAYDANQQTWSPEGTDYDGLWEGWTLPATCTVTFSSQEETTVEVQVVINGDYILKPADPTSAGFTFGGWYTSSDCKDDDRWNFNYSPVTEDLTLYAKWIAEGQVVNYTVDYNSREGSFVASETVQDGTYATEPIDPTRDGYSFGGWYTTSDCHDDDRWNFNTSQVIADTTLYAKWIADVVIANYTVEFNSQEGSAVASQTVQDGDYAIEPLDPTKSGNTFAGWYTSSACDDNDRWNFATSQVIEDTTLYAKWIPDAQVVFYDVDYDSQNGSQVAGESVQENDYATKPLDPTRAGYSFGGWYTTSDCHDGDRWNFNTSQVIADTTLYAKWIANVVIVDYTLEFNSQEGSVVASQTVQNGDYATEPLDPTKSGNTFAGWYTSSACDDDDRWNFATSQVIRDMTLYAKWIPDAQVVFYDVDYNSQNGSQVASETVQANDYATEPSQPTRGGYTFGGWYTSSECKDGDRWNFHTSQVIGDTVLYANWIPDAQVVYYDVDYDSQNGSQVVGESVQENDYATEPVDPTKAGYSFGGWYTTSDCHDGDRWNFNTSQVIGDTTLYAKWIANAVIVDYTVEFNSQEGSAVASQTVQNGDYITEPANPTRSGYSFEGWYTTSTCNNGDAWNFDLITIASDMTLYAKWDSTATEKVVVKKYITEYVTSPSEDDDEEDLGDLTEDIPESVLEAESNDPIFTDIINHWGQEAIEALAKLGVVNGIGNGLFNPDGTISRAEFVTMIVRYFELEAFATDLGYTDVEESDWFSEYVWIARENDILPDFYGSEFEPHTAVTREEMMFILYKTLVLTDRLGDYPDGGDSLSDFTDGELVAEYATTSCEYLISRDIINGRGNGSLNPQGTSSRAEVCQMLWNMIKK